MIIISIITIIITTVLYTCVVHPSPAWYGWNDTRAERFEKRAMTIKITTSFFFPKYCREKSMPENLWLFVDVVKETLSRKRCQ
mmetsp:Transcript_275/g.456  ORF Transcript_275/g.456 Transcript_275/m.456 type:complete len:83 (-) Transcript_275:308-556(-)